MKIAGFGFAGAAVAALALAGCGDCCGKKDAEKKTPSEAEIFGYKGNDLVDDTNLTYIVVSEGVTNWVPERVLSVIESYDLTPDEEGAIKAAGVLMPGADHAAFPEGYAEETKEPWFSLWTKPSESFGLKGVAGVLGHFDETKGAWQTSESYFSSYWPTEEEARAALAKVRDAFAADHKAKKFYDFADCWVAEYVRLSVMGVVGKKADGRWSCMIDFRDKCNVGCGPWESVEVQQERRDAYEYAKAMRAWKAAVAEVAAKNRAAVDAAMSARGLAGFEEAREVQKSDIGLPVKMLFGTGAAIAAGADPEAELAKEWAARVEAVAKSLGVEIAGEVAKEVVNGGGGIVWSAGGKGDLYDVQLDVFAPVVAEASSAEADAGEGVRRVEGNAPYQSGAGDSNANEEERRVEGNAPYQSADGAAKAEGDENNAAEEEVAKEEPPVQWRIVFVEKIQNGIEVPKRPERPARGNAD